MRFCSRSTPLFVFISFTLMRYWDRKEKRGGVGGAFSGNDTRRAKMRSGSRRWKFGYLAHAQLEGAPLLLELLGNFPSAHLAPNHPVLPRQLPLLLLHLLAEHTHTHADTHTQSELLICQFYQLTPADKSFPGFLNYVGCDSLHAIKHNKEALKIEGKECTRYVNSVTSLMWSSLTICSHNLATLGRKASLDPAERRRRKRDFCDALGINQL